MMVQAAMVPALLVSFSLVAQAPDAAQAKQLTLREAIQVALQNNLQVSIAQQSREVTRSGVQVNQGPFDWNLAASAQIQQLKTASDRPQSVGVPANPYTNTATNRNLTADVNKLFAWGGTIDVNYSPAYNFNKTVYINALLDVNGNPIGNRTSTSASPYAGSLTATYTQPLLRGFGFQVTTANLVVARKNAESADFTYQLAIINLVSATENQYWDLIFAERNMVNKRSTLELAQKLLKENTIRVEVGTMAPIEVTSAEAQVAQAEQDIIAGEAAVRNAQDALQRALYPNTPQSAVLKPTDTPDLGHIQVDETAAVKMALARRVELKGARINQDIAKVQEQAAVNRTLPQLDAFVAYNGATDTYGTIGPVNSDLVGFKQPGYTVGLRFSVPLQNRAAKGNLSIARANMRSSELNLRDLELSISLGARTAARNVEAAEKGVKAAAKTRYYQERNLEAEHKKFENGMSTNFVVLQVMTNLDNAKSAELNAQITYARAVTALEVAVGNLMEARNFTIK
jgi:outer membrane protein TolC